MKQVVHRHMYTRNDEARANRSEQAPATLTLLDTHDELLSAIIHRPQNASLFLIYHVRWSFLPGQKLSSLKRDVTTLKRDAGPAQGTRKLAE